jgi:diguanylate cyclase (GGDEF)-like protein
LSIPDANHPLQKPATRVLLIEDNEEDAFIAREALQDSAACSYRIADAETWTEAEEKLKEDCFDVILADLHLPDAEGLDLLKKILEAAPNIPIVVLTGLDDEHMALEALKLGSQDYLVKTELQSSVVTRALRYAIERHRLVQDLAAARDRERHLATHDSLTGLPNRKLFMDRLELSAAYASRYQQRIALIFLDLDNFKTINDTLGHPTGDELLKKVSSRLKQVVRSSDTLARIGGDEFTTIIQRVLEPQNAAVVARKLMKEFSQPYWLGGEKYFVTASIGITLCPDDGTTPEELIEKADAAMYRAKQSGRNRFCFHDDGINSQIESE